MLAKLSAMPITIWNYKKDSSGERHVGPVAEDFYGAFGLGHDDKHVSFGDTSGIALLAVQGLIAELTEKETAIEALRQRNSELAERLEALEQLVTTFAEGAGVQRD